MAYVLPASAYVSQEERAASQLLEQHIAYAAAETNAALGESIGVGELLDTNSDVDATAERPGSAGRGGGTVLSFAADEEFQPPAGYHPERSNSAGAAYDSSDDDEEREAVEYAGRVRASAAPAPAAGCPAALPC